VNGRATHHDKEDDVMSKRVTASVIGAALLIAPAGALAATAQRSQTVDWQIPLSAGKGFARATGSAQYQAQPGQRELQIELDHLGFLSGRTLVVQVNGATVGSMKVSQRGIAQLTLNTERGQRVPVVVHGSTVTTKGAAVIASGTF
jgi:hypothetical protein